jgi:hypothetical protein
MSSVLLLSVSVAAKFHITRTYSLKYVRTLGNDEDVPEKLVVLTALSLLLAFSLPTDRLYLGQIPPNVWHSSTTIFVMPFALLLFLFSYEQLVRPTTARLVCLTALSLLNVAIKPSFFLVFTVAYPVMLMGLFGLTRRFWANLAPVLVGGAMTTALYYLIYVRGITPLHSEGAGIEIKPFAVWSHFSSNIPLSLLCSLLFPLTFLAVFRRELSTRLILRYAVITYFVSVAMLALLAETGLREFHGNFLWQAVISSYILFLVASLLFLMKIRRFGFRDWRNRIVGLAWTAHVFSGILYIGKLLVTRNYY